jgi:chromosome segregation ATPase
LAQTPDLALLERLRHVVARRPVTETELRGLIEQADGLVRTLSAHMAGSERRLNELAGDPDSSLKEIASELHRVDSLRPRLEEARSLLAGLEQRAREVRTSWLIRQADGPLKR